MKKSLKCHFDFTNSTSNICKGNPFDEILCYEYMPASKRGFVNEDFRSKSTAYDNAIVSATCRMIQHSVSSFNGLFCFILFPLVLFRSFHISYKCSD